MPGFYHLSIKIGSRSTGRSAVAAAAYRSGTKIKDEETGILSNYTRKGGVVYSEIVLPVNAPKEYADRKILWNAVQKIEKQGNAQLFREYEIAFPKELSPEQRIETAREFAQHRAAEGMVADFSIHNPDKATGNPHCHMMCTTRRILSDGSWAPKEKKDYVYELDGNGNRIPEIDPETGKQNVKIIRGEEQLQWKKVPEIDPRTGKQKVRVRKGKGEEKVWKRTTVEANDWNSWGKAEEWRKDWADVCNRYLEQEERIDHRSYERQGIDRIPTIHEGYKARGIEERGGVADRSEINREILQANELLDRLKEEIQDRIRSLTEWMKEAADALRERIAEIQRRAAGGGADDGGPAEARRGHGGTAGRDRQAEGREPEIARREREAAGIAAEEQRIAEEAERRKPEIARTESEIAGILEGIRVRRKARDDRIRELMERRRSSRPDGEAAGRDRGAEAAAVGKGADDTEAVIEEAEALIDRAEAERRDREAERRSSEAERRNREAERERPAAGSRCRGDEEGGRAEKAGRSRHGHGRSDDLQR